MNIFETGSAEGDYGNVTLLGGFSASTVHRLLTRLLGLVEKLAPNNQCKGREAESYSDDTTNRSKNKQPVDDRPAASSTSALAPIDQDAASAS